MTYLESVYNNHLILEENRQSVCARFSSSISLMLG